MKLIIQIPCYNEEETLPQVIADLPAELPGIDQLEYLVIDDGSTDRTQAVARKLAVHHVLGLGSNRSYGTAFMMGLRKCIELGADIIVNTDGDNQYQGANVKDLVLPILEGDADIVVGCRPIEEMKDFSWLKKKLQRLGSYVVRRFSGVDVSDATSGFRAYSADAAMRLHILSKYSHSLETIIQAGYLNLRVSQVPIAVNPKTRESRLMSSTWQYIYRSLTIVLRSYTRFRPLRTFVFLAILPGLGGLAICIRFLYFYFTQNHAGHIQSLILAAIMLLIAFHLIVLGIIADLAGVHGNINQEILYFVRRQTRTRGDSGDNDRIK